MPSVGSWARLACDTLVSRQRGQGLVEFALLVPIFIVVLLGAVDFGRLMQARVTAESATRAGASWGAAILANAQQGLAPVYSLAEAPFCDYGPTCNIEVRACTEAQGFPGYSGGPLLRGYGDNPLMYRDCAANYAASTNSTSGVCNPSATQSNPFYSVTWWRSDGTTKFTPTPTTPAHAGETIEVLGRFCFKTLFPWPVVPSPIILNISARYTIQP